MLDSLGLDIFNLRLELVTHFLQRHSEWMVLNKCLDISPEVFLTPLINIASSWLATTSRGEITNQPPQWWKRSFKFHIGLAISVLFEYLEFCANREVSNGFASVVSHWCRRIVHANSNIFNLDDMGIILSMWKTYHRKIEPSECDCSNCTTDPYT